MLLPIQASYFALEGTDDMLETIDKIKIRANPQLQILADPAMERRAVVGHGLPLDRRPLTAPYP